MCCNFFPTLPIFILMPSLKREREKCDSIFFPFPIALKLHRHCSCDLNDKFDFFFESWNGERGGKK